MIVFAVVVLPLICSVLASLLAFSEEIFAEETETVKDKAVFFIKIYGLIQFISLALWFLIHEL